MNGHKYKTFRPPARVWVDEDSEWWPTQSRSDTEEYIRADLVDELVGMLEKMVNDLVDERLSHWVPVENMFEDEEIIEIRQAIAKMKEEA